MSASDSAVAFQLAGPAVLRACPQAALSAPGWPDVDAHTPAGALAAQAWLRRVWASGAVAEAIGHASPDLAGAVVRQCTADPASLNARKVSRSVLSVTRYLLRMAGRPTPFGLFAGVGPARFGPRAVMVWGEGHRPVARPAAGWLTEVVTGLEASPRVLALLQVMVNSTATVRGEHLIVPHQPRADDHRGAIPTEVAVRLNPAARLVVDAAQSAVAVTDLVAKLHAEAPTVPVERIFAMLSTLVTRGALVTNLRVPSTEIDAVGHLLRVLDAAGAADLAEVAALVALLQEIAGLLDQHNTMPSGGQPAVREQLASRMRTRSRSTRHPLALDLRLDVTAVLPQRVAVDVREAALLLARLSEFPYGTPAWRDYHRVFYERYGIGALVPVLELVDPDSGIGLPAGYPGSLVQAPKPALKARDELLLSLAQAAALEGRRELVLDAAMVAALDAGPTPPRLPPHLELGIRVNAADLQALQQGRYTMEVLQASRNVGGLTGRFLPVLDQETAARHVAAIRALSSLDGGTVVVQASYPPLDPATTHVARAPRVLPTLLSLAEHQPRDDSTITLRGLAVGCDGRRLYLAVPARGHRIEAVALHSLNLRTHTPPLARFVIELGRAQCAQVTGFRWGAATTLPFRPRLRTGRIILAPATWRLPATDLPGPDTPTGRWDGALAAWQARRAMPVQVRLHVDDQRLLLDLDQRAHREVLRRHLHRAGCATLTEVVDPQGAGWCAGRPHEVVVGLQACGPSPWPRLPTPCPERVIHRGHGDTPATSLIVYAHLYGDIRRQDLLLAEHLPDLLACFDTEPLWWFLRYRDADRLDPHLRLRIRLANPDAFGPTTRLVSAWADRLHHAGLLREVRYPTSYPETGRWGSGPVLSAAEKVFAADSRAVLAQLRQAHRPHRQALIAAHTTAITAAFLGDMGAAMRWLIEHLPAAAPRTPVPRPVLRDAVRLANPDAGFAALRAAPGGAAIVDAWWPRHAALTAWRALLSTPGPDSAAINGDDALRHILHGHYIRAYGIDFDDEPVCLHLARAAAHAWRARTHASPS